MNAARRARATFLLVALIGGMLRPAFAELRTVPEELSRIPLDSTQNQVLQDLQDGDPEAARALLLSEQKKIAADKQDANLVYLQAFVEQERGNYRGAVSYLQRVKNLLERQGALKDRAQVLLLKRMGDCYYELRDISAAATQYRAALSLCDNLDALAPVRACVLESLMGCAIKQGDYAAAESYGKTLVDLTRQRAQSGELSDQASYFWAQLELAQVYKRLGKLTEGLALRDSIKAMLDRALSVRAQLHAAGALPSFEALNEAFLRGYLAENQPATLAEYLWLTCEFRMRSLPLISWEPDQQPPKAAILCVHGLGLENRAFNFFGREMARRGFVIYAVDVRGFGAWLAAPGQEDAHFDHCVSDLRIVLGLINERNPGVPVFLLGESMGGALVLKATAEINNGLSGVISSVPSPERYGQRRMTWAVAKHFLRNPKEPFDIGKMVTEQATSHEAVKEMWRADPKAKMDLSPDELMAFSSFMRKAAESCKNIKTTPVLIVQGLKDRLVKPQGTYEMFDSVSVDDKTLLIIGTAEHLIFETPQQSPVLLDGVTTWVLHHIPEAPAREASTGPAH